MPALANGFNKIIFMTVVDLNEKTDLRKQLMLAADCGLTHFSVTKTELATSACIRTLRSFSTVSYTQHLRLEENTDL